MPMNELDHGEPERPIRYSPYRGGSRGVTADVLVGYWCEQGIWKRRDMEKSFQQQFPAMYKTRKNGGYC